MATLEQKYFVDQLEQIAAQLKEAGNIPAGQLVEIAARNLETPKPILDLLSNPLKASIISERDSEAGQALARMERIRARDRERSRLYRQRPEVKEHKREYEREYMRERRRLKRESSQGA
jgi:hypothetical protein